MRTDHTMAPKKKGGGQTKINKTLHRKLKNEQQRTPQKTGGELRRASNSCSTSGTCRDTLFAIYRVRTGA